MSKERKLKLAHPVADGKGRNDGYEVIEVHNTTAMVPGQILTKLEVSDLCNLGLYEVTVVGKRKEREYERKV